MMVSSRRAGVPVSSGPVYAPIQPSAWKENSANFAVTEFSEVRRGVTHLIALVLDIAMLVLDTTQGEGGESRD